MKKRYKIENLGCPTCAAKMEDRIGEIQGVEGVNISFITQKMKLELDEKADLENILDESSKIIKSIEYDAKLVY